MTTISVREVRTRDAATAILRKLGLKPNAYGLFMKQLETGVWAVDLPKVHEAGYAVNGVAGKQPSLKNAKDPVVIRDSGKNVAIGRTATVEKMVKTPKARKTSISSVAEDLILAGKTNDEVFAQLKEKFKLDDSKKSYPSWFRSRLKRQGKLEKKS